MGALETITGQHSVLALIAVFHWTLGAAALLICPQWEWRMTGVSCVFAGTMAAVLPVLAAMGYA